MKRLLNKRERLIKRHLEAGWRLMVRHDKWGRVYLCTLSRGMERHQSESGRRKAECTQ